MSDPPDDDERSERFRQLLAFLPPPLRDLLEAVVLRGETLSEVAARAGRSPAAVRKAIERALHVLREKLGPDPPSGVPSGR